jgi:CheY-like chemotaxis protein
MAEFEAGMNRPVTGPVYRGAITIDFEKGILGIEPDPFPTLPRPRVLVVTEDVEPARALRADFEVVHVDDGWAAVEQVEKTEFAIILCALRVSGMSGASLHRLIAKTRPGAVAKIAFLASAETAAAAPPSSASGRIVALPLTAERVRHLLEN